MKRCAIVFFVALVLWPLQPAAAVPRRAIDKDFVALLLKFNTSIWRHTVGGSKALHPKSLVEMPGGYFGIGLTDDDGGTETFALAFGKNPNRPLFLRLVHSLPASRAAEMADAANRDRFAREIAGALLPDCRVKVAYRLSGDGAPVFTFTISDPSLPEPDERAIVPQPGSHLLHIVDKSAIPVRKLRNWHDVLRRDYIAQLFSYKRNDWETHVMAGEHDWAATGDQRRDGSYRSITLKPPGDLKVYVQPMYDAAAKTPSAIGVSLSAPPDGSVAFPDKAHCDRIIGTVKQALGTDYRVQTRYGKHDELTLEFYIFRSNR